MRKRYVEKLSFYKLLEELATLPDETSLAPIFIDKIFDVKLQYVDFFVVVSRCNLDHFGNYYESFTFRFCYKSKNDRISFSSRFACEIELRDFELTEFVLNSRILTVADFFLAAFNSYVNYSDALSKVQNSDNERFALIQSF